MISATNYDPTQLPCLGDDIPMYFKDIIAACRALCPCQRVPAYRLLTMFPSELALGGAPSDGWVNSEQSKVLTRPEDCLKQWGVVILCDLCGIDTSDHYYRCTQCEDGGDFDVCRRCFSNSGHCLDSDHHLQEWSRADDDEACYSSVKADGRRSRWIA
jgi:hypothetical protein